METKIEKISNKRLEEILNWDHSATYNPGGNKNGKKTKSHPQSYLHGRKLTYTQQGLVSWDGLPNGFSNGTDIDIGETVVVNGGWNYTEARCIGKTIRQRRYSSDISDLDSFYICYRFRNVKKDGTLGKKFYHTCSSEVILESEGEVKFGSKQLPFNCAEKCW